MPNLFRLSFPKGNTCEGYVLLLEILQLLLDTTHLGKRKVDMQSPTFDGPDTRRRINSVNKNDVRCADDGARNFKRILAQKFD